MSSKSQLKYYEKSNQALDNNQPYPSSLPITQKNGYLCFANIQNLPKSPSSINKKTCCHRSPKVSRKENSSHKQNIRSPNREYPQKFQHVFEQENKSLRRTIQTLKDQIQSLQGSYEYMKEKNKNIRRQFEERERGYLKKLEDYENLRKKSEQFDELMPRIEELQVLQDKVIEENRAIKKNQTNLKQIVANILVMVGNSTNQTLVNIRNLIKKKSG